MLSPRNGRRYEKPLSRETMLTIAALKSNAEAVHRLRRAAFGLDREDRIAVAEQISASSAMTLRRSRRRQVSARVR